MTTRKATRRAAMIRRALAVKPEEDQPAMYVLIVTDAHGAGARLAWSDTELPDPKHYPDFKVLRRFACFPVEVMAELDEVPELPKPAWPFPVSAHEDRP